MNQICVALTFALGAGIASGDEVTFSNGKAANHPENGLICTPADENQFVLEEGGFEILTIAGTPEDK